MDDSRALRGSLFIVSGPSGVGKTVLCNEMVRRFAPTMIYSISATSRPPRGGEIDGQEYFFLTKDEFQRGIDQGRYAEWACVHGNFYGTPKSFLDQHLGQGRHVVLNIDVQGATRIQQEYPEAVLIFILPPSLEILEERLRARNRDTEEELCQRLENARAEIAGKGRYRHHLVNDDLGLVVQALGNIFRRYLEEGNPLNPAAEERA